MNHWSNIEVPKNDPEIRVIDKFERTLKDIPPNVSQIRELIMGFEVCHFKLHRHLLYIKESISNLKGNIQLKDIGANHIRQGVHAWKNDTTKRSLTGQIYVWSLQKWLGEEPPVEGIDEFQNHVGQITAWLGDRSSEKERLVRLLIARLTWDWESYNKLLNAEENKELEYQVCRIDICHYNFPDNIIRVVKGIGALKPVDGFEGCGSVNHRIKKTLEKEFTLLNDDLRSVYQVQQSVRDNAYKAWLIASLAKTIKEQAGITDPIDGLSSLKQHWK